MKRVCVLLGIFLLVATGLVYGLEVSAHFDKDKILLGQDLGLAIDISGDMDCLDVVFPSHDEFYPFVIKQEMPCQKTEKGIEKRYVVTVFALGKQELGGLKLIYKGKEYPVPAVSVYVKGLLPNDVTKVRMRGIKDMIVVPFPWGYLGIFLLVAIFLFLGVGIFLKKKDKEELSSPVRPYWEVAQERISKLSRSALIELGHYKQFYYELTEILRYYIQNRYGIPALEMTNTEFLDALRQLELEDSIRSALRELVERSGPIKYAGFGLDSESQARSDLELVRSILVRPETDGTGDNSSPSNS